MTSKEIVALFALAERATVALEQIAESVHADPNTLKAELDGYRETIEAALKERDEMAAQALGLLSELHKIDPEKYGPKEE
jgi:hypothetical protein